MEARTYLVEAQHSLAKTTLRNHFSALKGLFAYTTKRYLRFKSICQPYIAKVREKPPQIPF